MLLFFLIHISVLYGSVPKQWHSFLKTSLRRLELPSLNSSGNSGALPKLCLGGFILCPQAKQGGHIELISGIDGCGKSAQTMVKETTQTSFLAHAPMDTWHVQRHKKISCQYSGYNIVFKVHEHSKYPNYLAIVVFYVAGQNDITAVELWREALRRVYGAVWDMENPPRGSISLRLQATSTEGVTYSVQSVNAIPNDWKAGATYDSNVQIN
ncbi:hypothetical protein UlMin_001518 [Ulmus minor]